MINRALQTTTIPLDENGFLLLDLTRDEAEGVVHGRLHSAYCEDSGLVRHALPLLQVAEGGGWGTTPAAPSFDLDLPRAGETMEIRLNNQDFAQLRWKENDAPPVVHVNRRLCVYETRLIGRAPQLSFPYPQADLARVQTPVTDLHTHLSGQISAEDLIALGCEHHVAYPVAALKALGIDYPEDNLLTIPKRMFLPWAHLFHAEEKTEQAVELGTLSAASLKRLKSALSLNPEGESIFEDLETCYYLREPFTKNLDLLPALLRRVAEDYQRQGIRYAELSSNAVLDPIWLAKIHEVLPQVEKDTGVSLRFLAGIPRNLSKEDIAQRIEAYQRIAPSPYVAGIDILGYEMNKTSEIPCLDALAQWMAAAVPDQVLRIHAGENPKNPENVYEALQLAERTGARIRVGHALHGMDEKTMELAQALSARHKSDPLFELCPDSNVANNNTPPSGQWPFSRLAALRLPMVLSSDGGGIHSTDALQTAMAGMFSGLSYDALQDIRHTEQQYIARQQDIFARKTQALPPDFLEVLKAQPSALAVKRVSVPPPPLPENLMQYDRLKGKRPLFIGGSTGRSWDQVPESQKQEIRSAFRRLLDGLDPENVFFAIGRIKDRGVGIELANLVEEYNQKHTEKFDCALLVAERSEQVTPQKGISHVFDLQCGRLALASTFAKFVKERGGAGIFFGGQAFTPDIILKFLKAGIGAALMREAGGASAQKADIYEDHAVSIARLLSWAKDALRPPRNDVVVGSIEPARERVAPTPARMPGALQP